MRPYPQSKKTREGLFLGADRENRTQLVATLRSRSRLTVASRHVPAFDSPREQSSLLTLSAQLFASLIVVRIGRIEHYMFSTP